jgi:hypothetical protein
MVGTHLAAWMDNAVMIASNFLGVNDSKIPSEFLRDLTFELLKSFSFLFLIIDGMALNRVSVC